MLHGSHETTVRGGPAAFWEWHLTTSRLAGLSWHSFEHMFEFGSGGGAGEARRRRTPPASPRRGLFVVSITTPTQEAAVPALAPLIPSFGPRSNNPDRYASAGHCRSNDRRESDENCPPSVRALLEQARQGLVDAEYATRPAERYALAHLAALRAAAAILAVRARPRRRARPISAWTLLTTVAPELAEWCAFFAAASAIRAAVEAGVSRLVTNRDADDMVRQASQFLTLAQLSITRTFR